MKKVNLLIWSLAFAAVSLLTSTSEAQWSTDPSVNNPICTGPGDQAVPAAVSDGSGGAIIAWEDNRDTTGDDIYAQRINAHGEVLWTMNGVAICRATGQQEYPVIVGDGAGGAIITWMDGRDDDLEIGDWDIYAQRINSDGTVLWDSNGVVVCNAADVQYYPIIVGDGAGGAIIAWYDYRENSQGYHDIYAQRIDPDGNIKWDSSGVAILSGTTQSLDFPVMCSDGLGGAIVAWDDGRGSDWNVFAQRISGSGAVQWTTNGVDVCSATASQTEPALTGDGGGGAIITWADDRQVGSYTLNHIYAQRIDAGGSTQWGATGIPVCVTDVQEQFYPAVIGEGSGGAIITWHDWRNLINYGASVYAQRLNASGEAQWAANGAAVCIGTGDQVVNPIITNDGRGGAIIAWSDSRGSDCDVYAQRLDSNGAAKWHQNGASICTASGNQTYPAGKSYPAIVSDKSAGAITAWQDYRSGTDWDVYAQRVDSSGNLGVATPAARTVTIAEARRDDNHDLIPDHSVIGDTLMLYGVITSPKKFMPNLIYYIQDSTGGIAIATPGAPMSDINFGDSVFVIGKITQSRGLTEIMSLGLDSAYFGWLKRNASLPAPKLLSAKELIPNAETVEGQLVQLDTLYKSSGTWPAASLGADLYFKQGTGADSVDVHIDPYTGIDGSKEPDYPANIIGILSQYSSDDTVVNDGYRILPRDTTDFVPAAILGVKDRLSDTPKEFRLSQNYPNPFNPSTTIRFEIKVTSKVTLEVFNVLGQKVLERNYGNLSGGNYQRDLDMDQCSSGVYFYTLRAIGTNGKTFHATKKMLLMK